MIILTITCVIIIIIIIIIVFQAREAADLQRREEQAAKALALEHIRALASGAPLPGVGDDPGAHWTAAGR